MHEPQCQRRVDFPELYRLRQVSQQLRKVPRRLDYRNLRTIRDPQFLRGCPLAETFLSGWRNYRIAFTYRLSQLPDRSRNLANLRVGGVRHEFANSGNFRRIPADKHNRNPACRFRVPQPDRNLAAMTGKPRQV